MALQETGLKLVADGSAQFVSGLRGATDATSGFTTSLTGASKGVTGFGQVAIGALREVGAVAVRALGEAGRAMAAFAKDSITAAGDFESTLLTMQATSGATADELAQISDKAIALGADLTLPNTSANEAALAMLELSKAGLSVEASMDAAKGTLQLAAAAQTDAATAAQITANALNAFQLPATEAVKVADLLAAAANASSASMTDLSQGLQQGAFAFNAAGLSIEELTASLAILTNVGLTGSDAGTALKNAIMRLSAPTDKAAKLMAQLGIDVFDAQGNMLPMRDIIAELQSGFSGMTMEQRNAAISTIFLSDGMKAMIPLLDQGVAGFDGMVEAVTKQGAAADVAGAQAAGFNGSLQGLQSQVETLQLVIGQQLLPILTPLIQAFSAGVADVTAFAGTFMKLAPALETSTAPFQTLINILRVALPASWLPAIKDAETFGNQVLAVGAQAQAGAQVIADVIGQGLAAAAAFWVEYGAQITATASSVFTAASGVVQTVMATISTMIGGALAVASAFWAEHGAQITAFAVSTFTQVGAIVTSAMTLIQTIITTVLTAAQAFWAQWGTTIMAVVGAAMQGVMTVIQTVLGVIQNAINFWTAVVRGDWDATWQALVATAESLLATAEAIIDGVLNTITTLFGSSLESVRATWQSNLEQLPGLAQAVMERAIEAFNTALEQAPGVGKAIIDGIRSGIEGAVKSLAEAAASAASAALDAAKKALGIQSPSKEGLAIGENFGKAEASGMLKAQPAMEKASRTINLSAIDVANDTLADLGSQITGGVKRSKQKSKKAPATPATPTMTAPIPPPEPVDPWAHVGGLVRAHAMAAGLIPRSMVSAPPTPQAGLMAQQIQIGGNIGVNVQTNGQLAQYIDTQVQQQIQAQAVRTDQRVRVQRIGRRSYNGRNW